MTTQNKSSTTTQGNKNKESSKSARELESEIEQTRSGITGDIQALSDKFSPSHLKEEAKEAVVEAKNVVADKAVEVKDAVVDKAIEMKDVATEKAVELKEQASETLSHAKEVASEKIEEVSEQAQEIGSATWRFTKANAVPLALVGVGAGWMIANSRKDRDFDYYEYEVEAPATYTEVEVQDYGYSEPYGVSQASSRGVSPPIRERTRASTRRPAQPRKPSALRSRQPTRSLTARAGDSARRAEEMIVNRAHEGTELLRRGWDRVRSSSSTFASDKPLVAALGVLAAGIGLGMMLPSSERENKLLEPARAKVNRMLGDARQAASDAVQTAKDTAKDTMHAIS